MRKMIRHGLSGTRQYQIYKLMKSRCYNKNHMHYNLYGGRGIYICKEWLDDFRNFYNWSINNGYSDELSIDRINNNEHYYPENCRWVNAVTQANNKSTNRTVTIGNENKTLAMWGRDERCQVNIKQFTGRIRYGMDPEKALNTPKTRKTTSIKRYECFGEIKKLPEWAKDERCVVGYNTLKDRLRIGWGNRRCFNAKKR